MGIVEINICQEAQIEFGDLVEHFFLITVGGDDFFIPLHVMITPCDTFVQWASSLGILEVERLCLHLTDVYMLRRSTH